MTLIEPAQFKDAFLRAAGEHATDLASSWCAGPSAYTPAFRKLIPPIAQHLGLQFYNADYYTLDAILYEHNDTKWFSPNQVYAKHITVAIEHENKLLGSQKEMNKLQLFNAPLKVLITYPSPRQRPAALEMYAEIIRDADAFQDITATRKQLIIFGSCHEQQMQWSFHVYRSGGFIDLI